jgi:NADH dehydrogenase
MTNHYVCILGGTGFVGQHLAVQLNRMKITNKILTRQSQQHRELLVLPYSRLVEVDVFDLDSLSAEFESCTTVINLIGILNESGHDGTGFRQVHFNLTRKILQAAQQSGVKQLLHMSALNADASKGTSYYLRSKGEAEDYLHTFHGSMRLTTFRPSVIFGPGDSFFNRFAKLLKISPGVFPLACAKTRFAPVYIGDVIDQFVRALSDRGMDNQRLNLCGPEIYTLRELVNYTAKTLEINRIIIALPDFLARIQALLMEYLIPIRLFSLDNYHSLQTDSICSQANCMMTDIHSVVPYYLGCLDQRSHYQTFRQNASRAENTAVRHNTDSLKES